MLYRTVLLFAECGEKPCIGLFDDSHRLPNDAAAGRGQRDEFALARLVENETDALKRKKSEQQRREPPVALTGKATGGSNFTCRILEQYRTANDDQQNEEYKDDTCTCKSAAKTASNFGHLIITPFVWRN